MSERQRAAVCGTRPNSLDAERTVTFDERRCKFRHDATEAVHVEYACSSEEDDSLCLLIDKQK